METILPATFSHLITVTQLLANVNVWHMNDLGFFATLFISVGLMIIFYQFLPGLMLFGEMIKGLFPSAGKKQSKFIFEARTRISQTSERKYFP